MTEGPRRRRANGWAWAYLALFGSDESEELPDSSTSDTGNDDTNERPRRSDP